MGAMILPLHSLPCRANIPPSHGLPWKKMLSLPPGPPPAGPSGPPPTGRPSSSRDYNQRSSPSRRPPAPRPPPTHFVELAKASAKDRVGVRFLAEGKDGAAVVDAVDAYGPAWLAKLRRGDAVTAIIYDGQEHATESGYRAAELLRPMTGKLRLRVRRPRASRQETAAQTIQAAWVGCTVRTALWEARNAALVVQREWRRFAAEVTVGESLLAARAIQYYARLFVARRREQADQALLRTVSTLFEARPVGVWTASPSIRAPASLDCF